MGSQQTDRKIKCDRQVKRKEGREERERERERERE